VKQRDRKGGRWGAPDAPRERPAQAPPRSDRWSTRGGVKSKSGAKGRRSWEDRGWHSAGDLGDAGDWPVSGWEQLVEDPERLDLTRAQRERRAREKHREQSHAG
jgi:hypothetical protein